MNRRDFLNAAGLLGISSAINSESVFGQTSYKNKMKPLKKIITIEEHFVLKKISQRVAEFNSKQNGGILSNDPVQKELMAFVLPAFDDIEDVGDRRIKFMDESGIDIQVLSYGVGSPQNITDHKLAIELCQEANNELANLIKIHPTRFAGFAILPVADPNAAAEELNRAVKELGFKGAMLSGTFNGRFFDEPEFLPIFSKAQELNVPLYMHPAIISKSIIEHYYKSDNWSSVASAMFASAGYGWHLDSGIAIVRLIASGIFDKLPGLQLISGHWGELVPFYLNRLDDQLSKTLKLNRKISDYYKSNIYVTPSGLFSEAQLQFVISEVGADRIIYSGDYPFLIDKNTKGFLETASISKEDKEKIAYRNAEKLLKLKV
jgi:predicted TIM-barrel fold metal-dependent hydrolase